MSPTRIAVRKLSGTVRRHLPLASGLLLVSCATASAIGLEPLAAGAARMLAQDALGALGKPGQVASRQSVAGHLVRQDRVKIDLTALSMAAFGDSEEPTTGR